MTVIDNIGVLRQDNISVLGSNRIFSNQCLIIQFCIPKDWDLADREKSIGEQKIVSVLREAAWLILDPNIIFEWISERGQDLKHKIISSISLKLRRAKTLQRNERNERDELTSKS